MVGLMWNFELAAKHKRTHFIATGSISMKIQTTSVYSWFLGNKRASWNGDQVSSVPVLVELCWAPKVAQYTSVDNKYNFFPTESIVCTYALHCSGTEWRLWVRQKKGSGGAGVDGCPILWCLLGPINTFVWHSDWSSNTRDLVFLLFQLVYKALTKISDMWLHLERGSSPVDW